MDPRQDVRQVTITPETKKNIIFPVDWMWLSGIKSEDLKPEGGNSYIIESIKLGGQKVKDSKISHTWHVPVSIGSVKGGEVEEIQDSVTRYNTFTMNLGVNQLDNLKECLAREFRDRDFIVHEMTIWNDSREKIEIIRENTAKVRQPRKMRLRIKKFKGQPWHAFEYQELVIACDGIQHDACKVDFSRRISDQADNSCED